MPTTEQVDYLAVRNQFKNEALDFTPWLAENLCVLSKAIEVELIDGHVEAQVGAFSCDILASEASTGVKVAIENQLELSDHGHLGQLLTYAAGLGAGIAVWVTPAFCYEHAEALHRLNQWTHTGIQFYGVKVTLQETGDAPPVPHFQAVVTPSYWNTDITQPKGAMSPLKQQYEDFFQPLIKELNGAGFADKAIYNFGKSGRFFPSRRDSGVGYASHT